MLGRLTKITAFIDTVKKGSDPRMGKRKEKLSNFL